MTHYYSDDLDHYKDPLPEKDLDAIKARLPQKGFMRQGDEILLSQKGFLRESDRFLLIRLLYKSSHQRATMRWMMSLPDAGFRVVSSSITNRLTKIPFQEEIAAYRRMGRLDAITPNRAIPLLIPVARAQEPALFDRVLNIGFSSEGPSYDDRHILRAIEAIQDPGTASIMARWIKKNPQRYLRAFQFNIHQIANNPKPAVVLLTIPDLEIPQDVISSIYKKMAGQSPLADLFMESNHQALTRYVLNKRIPLEQAIGHKLRDLKKMIHATT